MEISSLLGDTNHLKTVNTCVLLMSKSQANIKYILRIIVIVLWTSQWTHAQDSTQIGLVDKTTSLVNIPKI
jgi:hypothetical protein